MCNKKGELEEQELEKEDSTIEHRLKLTTDEVKKNLLVFDKIKAHELLNICVLFLGLMFFFELNLHNLNKSEQLPFYVSMIEQFFYLL